MLQQARPAIHQLFDPIRLVHRNPFAKMISGPISPLERNLKSPKGWKNRESDGIGLGILVALQKLDGRKAPESFTPVKSASPPISIGCPRDEMRCHWSCCADSGLDDDGYSDRGLLCGPPTRAAGHFQASWPADFLSNCYLCRKKLHGKDIYMYRGEKAFCSVECRHQQIVSDELQEKCGSEALRSSELSRSPYTDDRLFFMGITAS